MKLEWWDGTNPLVINPEIDLPGYHHGLLIVCDAINSYDTITIYSQKTPILDTYFPVPLSNPDTQVSEYEASKYVANYTNLRFELHLARRVQGTIISTLVPAFLYVAISYLSFFISNDVLGVRASICLFMLLNM